MRLTENFTLEELTGTSTNLANTPGPDETSRLAELALHILQPIRDRWGELRITSGFRSPEVNAKVGGAPTSQHVYGEAADFVPVNVPIDDVFEWIVNGSGLSFGQCINERRGGSRWVHISLPRDGKPNQEALVYDGRTYAKYIG